MGDEGDATGRRAGGQQRCCTAGQLSALQVERRGRAAGHRRAIEGDEMRAESSSPRSRASIAADPSSRAPGAGVVRRTRGRHDRQTVHVAEPAGAAATATAWALPRSAGGGACPGPSGTRSSLRQLALPWQREWRCGGAAGGPLQRSVSAGRPPDSPPHPVGVAAQGRATGHGSHQPWTQLLSCRAYKGPGFDSRALPGHSGRAGRALLFANSCHRVSVAASSGAAEASRRRRKAPPLPDWVSAPGGPDPPALPEDVTATLKAKYGIDARRGESLWKHRLQLRAM